MRTPQTGNFKNNMGMQSDFTYQGLDFPKFVRTIFLGSPFGVPISILLTLNPKPYPVFWLLV